ncbi:MAG TPA: cobyric acid synthase [Caproiciproducens sp.]|nr:cobyric acid synthase [Caproiciproducens sp.]
MSIKGIMIQGTSSDAGKSFIATGLCRVFSDMGYKVAPFKSQNMSNNSYVTWDGKEIGRAQGAQAEAARALPSVYMNPILLKPMMDTRSEVVLLGEVFRPMDGWEYHKDFTMETGLEVIRQSLDELSKEYDTIVIEGAGSPAEVNLNDREIVNMRVAALAHTPVILVTDIDRGGSFASLVGTIELVGENRRFIKGVIFNKFRGDISLLRDGLDWFEQYTGIPVIGVLPYLEDVSIETEDAQSRQRLEQHKIMEPLDIAVIGLKRVSNNTDVEPFQYEDDVRIRVVSCAHEFGCPHAVIIPGTKSTLDDMEELRRSGFDRVICEYAENGGIVFGVCGGYQMLGERICDELGVDRTSKGDRPGLGLLPIKTSFAAKKAVRRISGKIVCRRFYGLPVEGYEIHLGRTQRVGEAEDFLSLGDSLDGAVKNDGQIIGCYLHNIFHNDLFRNRWLNMVREKAGFPLRKPVDTTGSKELSFKKLADACRKYLNIDAILKMSENPID